MASTPKRVTVAIQAFINSVTNKNVSNALTAIFSRAWTRIQPTPATMTTAASILINDMVKGIINATPTATGATVAYTLPTGTLCDSKLRFDIDESFDWVLINNALAALDTITVTASTGHTLVGGAIVQSLHVTTGGITGYSATFRTRKTGANTYVTYRIGN